MSSGLSPVPEIIINHPRCIENPCSMVTCYDCPNWPSLVTWIKNNPQRFLAPPFTLDTGIGHIPNTNVEDPIWGLTIFSMIAFAKILIHK